MLQRSRFKLYTFFAAVVALVAGPSFSAPSGGPNCPSGKLGEQLGQRSNPARLEGRGAARERNTAPTGSHYDRRQASSHPHIQRVRRGAADDHRSAHRPRHIGGRTTHRPADRPKCHVQRRTGSHHSGGGGICLRPGFDERAGAGDARRHDPFYGAAKAADGPSRLARNELLCGWRPALGSGAKWSVHRRPLVLSDCGRCGTRASVGSRCNRRRFDRRWAWSRVQHQHALDGLSRRAAQGSEAPDRGAQRRHWQQLPRGSLRRTQRRRPLRPRRARAQRRSICHHPRRRKRSRDAYRAMHPFRLRPITHSSSG